MIDELFPKAQGRPVTVRQALNCVAGESVPPTPVRITDKFATYMAQVRPGQSAGDTLGTGYNWVRARMDKPAPTLPKAVSWGKYHMVWHPEEHRNFSGRELSRLQSYPDMYSFSGQYKDWAERIGNSVPPLFMYAIAAQIRHIMFGGPAIEKRMNDYPAHLDIMWQKALAPREPNAPTVVSTFAGGGGSLTGYLMAGYRDLLAVEWDDNAIATLRANYPDLDIYHGDIAKLTVDEVLERTGLEPGQLDILDGSPPCQGFSTAGKRLIDDPRNQLFREYVRLLRGLRPKVFVMENVSGMVKGKMKLVFVEILKELKASGYRVSAKLLNAMYFHVPQSRERMIFIGVRDDLGIAPTHPKAESKPVTVREAIGDMPTKGIPATFSFATAPPHMPPGSPNSRLRYLSHTLGLRRLAWDRVCPTMVTQEKRLAYPEGNDFLSVDAGKRIGTFPDSYIVLGDYPLAWRRIGNSVPPPFMEAIARHIRREILEATT